MTLDYENSISTATDLTDFDWEGVPILPSARFPVSQEVLANLRTTRLDRRNDPEVLVQTVDLTNSTGVTLKVPAMNEFLVSEKDRQENFVRSVRDEARILMSLDHPNIIRCFGSTFIQTTTGVLPAIVLEQIKGKNLGGILAQRVLSGEEAVRYLEPIADALDHCHSRGVVNQNIRPRWITITHDGRPVLTDFHVAGDGRWIIETFDIEKKEEIARFANLVLESLGVAIDIPYRFDLDALNKSNLDDRIKRLFRGYEFDSCRELIQDLKDTFEGFRIGRVETFYQDHLTEWAAVFSQRDISLRTAEPSDPRLHRVDDLIRQLANMIPENATILDLGFGPTGRDLQDLQSINGKKFKVVGAELVQDNIVAATADSEAHGHSLRGRLVEADIVGGIPFESGSVGAAILNSVIQYIEPGVFFEKILPQIHRVMKPGATFLVIFKSTVSKNEKRKFIDKLMKAEREFWFYNPEDVVEAAKKVGLTLVEADKQFIGGIIQWKDQLRDLPFTALYLRK